MRARLGDHPVELDHLALQRLVELLEHDGLRVQDGGRGDGEDHEGIFPGATMVVLCARGCGWRWMIGSPRRTADWTVA